MMKIMMKTIIVLCFVLIFLSGCLKQIASKPRVSEEETCTVSAAPVSSYTEPPAAISGSSEAPENPHEVSDADKQSDSFPSDVSQKPSLPDAPAEITTPKIQTEPSSPKTPTAASPPKTPASNPSPATDGSAAKEARSMLTETLQENFDILTHYANAKAGRLVVLFGLEDIMNEIKAAANTAAEKTSKCKAQGQSCSNENTLRRCYEESKKIRLRLEDCNDKIKAAKSAGDIDALQMELNNLLIVIEDDCKLMDRFLKEMKE